MKGAGGKRKGAGRLDAAFRAAGSLAAATKKIDEIQPKSADALIAALEAVKNEDVIEKTTETGFAIRKTIQVPDHNARIKAACALLNKRIPDIQKIQHEGGDPDKPVRTEERRRLALMTDDQLNQMLDASKKG